MFPQLVEVGNHYKSYYYDYFPLSAAERENHFSPHLKCKAVIKDLLCVRTLYMDL